MLEWQAEPFSGRTRDISVRGVYFTIDRELLPGSGFDFTLTLPAGITSGSQVLVRAQARVARVEKKGENGKGRVGVAAVIVKYEMIRAKSLLS